ncbi:hypothetical protein ACROYT_G035143 [Oculina patagonica]
MSAYGLNLPQDPLESNVEEVTEGEEEEVIEEYDFDSDSSLSLSHLSEDDDEERDALVHSILTTRNGRQIRAVARLDFLKNNIFQADLMYFSRTLQAGKSATALGNHFLILRDPGAVSQGNTKKTEQENRCKQEITRMSNDFPAQLALCRSNHLRGSASLNRIPLYQLDVQLNEKDGLKKMNFL